MHRGIIVDVSDFGILPHSGFVQQVKARGLGQAVTFFAKERKKAAISPKPVFEALNVKSSKVQALKNTAKLSECRKYRFALWRTWDDSKPYVMFVGLNPSTADETTDDPTLTRCINYAKSWGFGGVCMANIFAYRATEPSDMKAATDPIGSENNDW